MTLRKATLLVAALLAGAMVSGPALAKKKDAVAAPAAPAQDLTIDYAADHDPENILALDISTGGRVLIRLKPDWAPGSVARIKELARSGFYNGITFHRVIDGFMAQAGDPKGTGEGGSTLPDLKAEFNAAPHLRGTVSMARTDNPDSANSQFFIMFMPRFALDHRYTNFGRVIAGMDYVDAVEKGEPPEKPSRIVQASILADGKAPPPPSMAMASEPPVSILPPAPAAPAPRSGLKPGKPAAKAAKPKV